MPSDLDLRMMARCIELSRDSIAAGELPFGCVICHDEEVVTEATNRVVRDGDVTRHAEMVAMSKAQRVLCTIMWANRRHERDQEVAHQITVLDELIATTAQPVLTFTETSIPNWSFGSPQNVPERGIAWLGVRATPTRIRSRLPTIPLVGSNSTHPDPGT